MYLIVWLGNPGKEYEHTRHNVWFLFVDFLAGENDFPPFKAEPKFKGDVSTGLYKWEKILLLKPTTFMNLSGQSIKALADFYKIPQQNIIIVYDDISMEFGKVRTRESGSAGGHNGIKSIISYFWENFKRIKFWVGFNEKFEVSDWVLSKFTKEERADMEEIGYQKIEKELENLLSKK